MHQGICNPEYYGDLVCKFKKIIGNPNFSNLLSPSGFTYFAGDPMGS